MIQRLIGEVPNLRLVVAKLRLLVWEFRQLEHVRANDALGAILVRQSSGRNHRMVEVDPALRGHAFALVFIVVHTVNVHDSFVALALTACCQ